MSTNMVDYNVLKQRVVKCCKQTNKMTNFIIDLTKLNKLIADINLEAVNNFTCSKKVEANDIFPISLYLKENKLKWISIWRDYTILTFVLKDAIDDRCRSLLDHMNTSTLDDPEIDKTAIMAEIVADYPCYFVLVVSYRSNEPRRFNQLTYEAKCRSNLAIIKNANYGYTKPDDKEDNTTEPDHEVIIEDEEE